MGMFFVVGETKKRAGTYLRYQNITPSGSDTTDGIVAAVITADWGPLNKVVSVSKDDKANISKYFGSSGSVQVLTEAFTGGASTVLAVRAGTGGTSGTVALKDTASTPVAAINVTLKYPGTRAFQYIMRDVAGSTTTREFILIESGITVERLRFAMSDTGEADALIAAAAANSNYITMAKAAGYSGTGKLAAVAQTDFTAGTAPTVTTQAYSDALTALETQDFNAICIGSSDTAVLAVVQGFIDRVFQAGMMSFSILGEPVSVDWATRLADSAAYNDYLVVFVGHGWIDSDSGDTLDGYLAAARIAGKAAAISANNSLTHKMVENAVELAESLTGEQYDDAIDAGMMTFSLNSDGDVQIEEGINTLVNPSGNDDNGWKKIRRVKTRLELMRRASNASDKLQGDVDNDADGWAAVIAAVQGVINDMITEKKLRTGSTVELDSSQTPTGDSAWFAITVLDKDSLEKSYLTFGFQYATT